MTEVGPPQVTIQCDCSITFAFRGANRFTRGEILNTVYQEVWMAISEYKRTELHHADEAREIEDFAVRIATIENARKIEELCALVDLCPKSLFERFLGVL